MKQLSAFALLLLSAAAGAAEQKYMTPQQIHDKFLHPTTQAEKLKHLKAHKPHQIPKLTDTIPAAKLKALDAKKAARQKAKEEKSSGKVEKPNHTFWSWIFPEAYAMGCRQVAVTPTASPSAVSVPSPTPSSVVSPAPTTTPSTQPSVQPSPSPTGIPLSVDYRSRDEEIKDQFGGTCTAFGLAAAIENELTGATGVRRDLSERHLWSLYGQYDVYAAVAAALKYKITELQYWPDEYTKPTDPLYAQKARTKLVKAVELEDDTNAAIQALAAGHPVYVGMAVPSDLSYCETVISNNSSITSGGHAMAVVGYRKDPAASGGAYLILRNSWGTDCGDKGYLYFPVGLCEKKGMYCLFWSIEAVDAGPQLDPK